MYEKTLKHTLRCVIDSCHLSTRPLNISPVGSNIDQTDKEFRLRRTREGRVARANAAKVVARMSKVLRIHRPRIAPSNWTTNCNHFV